MKKRHGIASLALLALCCAIARPGDAPPAPFALDAGQTPGMSPDEVDFMLHGSMGDEFVPDRVMRAFVAANPDLFPGGDFSSYGVVGKGLETLPIGFSRRRIDHLGGENAIGINCMTCHTGTIEMPGQAPLLVLGMPGDFNAAGWAGAIVVCTLRSGSKEGIGPFLREYFRDWFHPNGPELGPAVDAKLAEQKAAIEKLIADDPFGANGVEAGHLQAIAPEDLVTGADRLGKQGDLLPLVRALMHLFHNMRVAVHVPEPPPQPTATVAGPGRNDAFGVLKAAFTTLKPSVSAPAKYGIPWNLAGRSWVHWDGNMNSPTARNVLATLGLGCPTDDGGHRLDFSLVKRQTELTERLRSPKYPFAVEAESAKRGEGIYSKNCASCHDAGEDKRLYEVKEVGTDPNRATIADPQLMGEFSKWMSSLKVEGYTFDPAGMRSTQKYWAADLAGVWARSPYLHNASVRTMRELLSAPSERPKSWKRGSRVYDEAGMGFRDEGSFVFDTTQPGNGNGGHGYGTTLTDADKSDLLEYLKTR